MGVHRVSRSDEVKDLEVNDGSGPSVITKVLMQGVREARVSMREENGHGSRGQSGQYHEPQNASSL